MQTVNFSRFKYVPSILLDAIGVMAYERLSPSTRAGILALFELCWHPRARDFEDSLNLLARIEHPFLLDIDKRPAPEPYEPRNPKNPLSAAFEYKQAKAAQVSFNSGLNELLRPKAGFYNWRALLSRFPNAIPVLQLTNPLAQREQLLRQADILCVGGACAAFRIKDTCGDALCRLVAELILRLANFQQILIILDCGQGRVRLSQRSAFVAQSLQTIESIVGQERMRALRIVCMSNSFTLSDHKGVQFKENYDWDLWRRVYTATPLAFGDYAGSQRDAEHSSFRLWDYRSTVTHTLPDGWLINRHANKNDPMGWHAGCQSIKKDGRFSPLPSWCDELISTTADAAEPNPVKSSVCHATRMNGHMERQFQLAKRRVR